MGSIPSLARLEIKHKVAAFNWEGYCISHGYMNQIISIAQIAVSVLVILMVLLQERSSAGGLGGIFGGGGGEGGFYQTRRGLEKFLFTATIILVIIFAGLALLNLVL